MEETNDSIPFTRNLYERSNSLAFTIPVELIEWMKAEKGDTIKVTGEVGKHGKYLTMWIPEKQDSEKGEASVKVQSD